jgi:DNA topoisomerase-1
VQLGDSDDEKPKFASLKRGQSIYSITLDEALELFEKALPYTLCEYEGEEVVVSEGPYGPYLRFKGEFISIPKSIDPLAITEEQAVKLIQDKDQKNEPIHVWGDIQVLNGRYGAYIKTPAGNFRIPKNVNVENLTAQEAAAIVDKGASAAPKPKKAAFKGKNRK